MLNKYKKEVEQIQKKKKDIINDIKSDKETSMKQQIQSL